MPAIVFHSRVMDHGLDDSPPAVVPSSAVTTLAHPRINRALKPHFSIDVPRLTTIHVMPLDPLVYCCIATLRSWRRERTTDKRFR